MICKTLCGLNLHYASPVILHLTYCAATTATSQLFRTFGVDPVSGPLHLRLSLSGPPFPPLISQLTLFLLNETFYYFPSDHKLLHPLPCFTVLHYAFIPSACTEHKECFIFFSYHLIFVSSKDRNLQESSKSSLFS